MYTISWRYHPLLWYPYLHGWEVVQTIPYSSLLAKMHPIQDLITHPPLPTSHHPPPHKLPQYPHPPVPQWMPKPTLLVHMKTSNIHDVKFPDILKLENEKQKFYNEDDMTRRPFYQSCLNMELLRSVLRILSATMILSRIISSHASVWAWFAKIAHLPRGTCMFQNLVVMVYSLRHQWRSLNLIFHMC